VRSQEVTALVEITPLVMPSQAVAANEAEGEPASGQQVSLLVIGARAAAAALLLLGSTVLFLMMTTLILPQF